MRWLVGALLVLTAVSVPSVDAAAESGCGNHRPRHDLPADARPAHGGVEVFVWDTSYSQEEGFGGRWHYLGTDCEQPAARAGACPDGNNLDSGSRQEPLPTGARPSHGGVEVYVPDGTYGEDGFGGHWESIGTDCIPLLDCVKHVEECIGAPAPGRPDALRLPDLGGH